MGPPDLVLGEVRGGVVGTGRVHLAASVGPADIAVIGHVATDQARRAGTLLFKPGVPCTSGTAALPLAYGLFPAQVPAQFDIVLDVGRPRPLCQTVRGGRTSASLRARRASVYRQGWRGPVRLVFGK